MKYLTYNKQCRCVLTLCILCINMKYQKTQFWGIVISWKSLVFPLIYFHVNEQWTAKPIRHTRQPISSASYKHERTAIKRSRSNSTKKDDSKGKLFPYFHVKPFIVTFCRICLWNKRNLYSNRCCCIMFVTIFSFCLLVSGSLSGWINWHALEKDVSK